jgi:hypothetical protein
VFIAEVLGKNYLTEAEIKRLRKNGLLTDVAGDLLREAYQFGVYSGRVPGKAPEDVKVGEFLRYMGGTLPALTFEERQTIDHAKNHIATHIRGLGNSFSKKVQSVLIDGDKKVRRTKILQIRGGVSEGISRRKTFKEIAQNLKSMVGEQQRDWLRVAATEVNNAFQEGRMLSIAKTAGGKDPKVFKRPAPDACPYCKLLYLKKDGVTPKVFKLSDLIKNGSNIGRKAGKPHPKHIGYKACVESTHPWCRCPLMHLPDGFGFDKDGEMVYVGFSKAA